MAQVYSCSILDVNCVIKPGEARIYSCVRNGAGIEIKSYENNTVKKTYTPDNNNQFLMDFGLRVETSVRENWNGIKYILFLGDYWYLFLHTAPLNFVDEQCTPVYGILLKQYSVILNSFAELNSVQTLTSQQNALNTALDSAFSGYPFP